MARIRSLKPTYWDDELLAKQTSRDARLLYPALWNFADEHSRLRGSGEYLKGKVFPYDDDLDAAAVTRLVDELVKTGKVVRYVVNRETYLYLPNLGKHNRLEPSKSKSAIPEPPIDDGEPALFALDDTDDARADFPGESAPIGDRGYGIGERGGRRQVRAEPAPPRYCPEHPTGTTRRCRPCGDAREAFQAWEAERRTRQANAPPCTTHPHELASNCRLCAAERKGRPDQPNRPEGTDQ